MTVETLTPTVNSKWRVDVDTSATETPEWTQVRAIQSFTPNVAPTVNDSTDYDSVGWGSDAITLRKWSLALVLGRRKGATGYPAGQEELRDASEALETVHVRWYERLADGTADPDGEAYEGTALVQWEPQGGEASGLSTVNCTLLGQGARTPITPPATP